MKKTILFTAGIVTFLFLQTSEAVETDKEAAAAHFQNGLALLKTENYKSAVTEFEASIELYETKNALFNLANCYETLHRYQEALDTFERLERTFSDSLTTDMKESVKQHRETLMSLVGELRITVDHSGAEIAVGERTVGSSPLERSLLLGPGEYEVVVSLNGFETFKKSVRLTSGHLMELDVTLSLAKGQLFITVNKPGATVHLDGEVVGKTPLSAPLEPGFGEHILKISKPDHVTIEEEVSVTSSDKTNLQFSLVALGDSITEGMKNKPSKLFWTGLGLTVASGVATGVFAGLAAGNKDDYNHFNDLIANNPGNVTEAVEWLNSRGEADDDYSRNKGLAWGFGIGTGVFAIATGVIFFVDRKSKVEKTTARVVPGGLRINF